MADPIQANFFVTTPLFLGDAGREASRLALASLKGPLRFWWRAWAYATSGAEETAAQEKGRLWDLHRREACLFGAAGREGENPGGQSRVLLRLVSAQLGTPLSVNSPLRDWQNQSAGAGARYLGYGLMGAFGPRAGMLDRSCYPAGGRFRVELLPRKDLRVEERDGLVAALKLLGLLGGIGARSRRGWGSLCLERLHGGGVTEWSAPTAPMQYAAALKEVLPARAELPGGLPPFTAFSHDSRIELVRIGDDPLRVLDEVGRAMQRYRAWGFRGRVNNQPSEQNFKRDHDWSKTPWHSEFRGFVPRRAAFGLPHNYGKGIGVKPAEGGDRRASPLLIHVHKFAPDRFAAILALLPAKFVPGDRVELTWPQQRAATPNHMPTDWPSVLHDFFDGPPDTRRGLAPYFPANQRTPVLLP